MLSPLLCSKVDIFRFFRFIFKLIQNLFLADKFLSYIVGTFNF